MPGRDTASRLSERPAGDDASAPDAVADADREGIAASGAGAEHRGGREDHEAGESGYRDGHEDVTVSFRA